MTYTCLRFGTVKFITHFLSHALTRKAQVGQIYLAIYLLCFKSFAGNKQNHVSTQLAFNWVATFDFIIIIII